MCNGSGLYWYHNDHFGPPQRMTAADSGAVAWSAGYAAFGQATIDPLSTIDNNLRFPGQYYDAESGLHYNYNRYYNPDTGRYLTTDPFKDGLNLYLYAFGNPINLYDPLGLASICDLHNALDLLGMIPGFGEVFDIANGLLYLLQGDYGMAALSAGAAIPVAGYLFNAIKGGKKLGKLFKYLKRFNSELGDAGHVVLRHGDDVSKKAAQLAKNKAVGTAAEVQAAKDLVSEGNTILGSQVSVRTAEGRRVIDHLVQDSNGTIKAIEVKSGGAVRNASQLADSVKKTLPAL